MQDNNSPDTDSEERHNVGSRPIESAVEELQIERINELARAGKGVWFGLIAYLAFMTINRAGSQRCGLLRRRFQY